ncbi:act minimal PKS acyl carrier protein [Nocardia tenerifensis]|uniref:Act minimal PKS acyl carrier protein n=2 Tax=Nocardia tenerifensis TaxID=228006 RepID=A0A318JYF0_9NOCA|nr:act minimal PKS acyl carrier protein [Nocardia tenerifensis]
MEDFQGIMFAAVGGDGANFVSDTDQEFEDLGYDSLALLEAGGRIEREYGISLDDSVLTGAKTPRSFVDAVNTAIAAGTAA